MFYRIKYMLKKKREKISLIFERFCDNGREMSKKEKLKKYLIKCFCHPITILKKIIYKELNIDYVEMVLTTRCTLNCKGCSALMNYYKKRSDMDIIKNIESIRKITNSCNSIKHLRLLGGEPLLYSKMFEMLEFLKKQDKIKRVTIVTNGTLLINDDRVIKILKNDKFDVFISNYGDTSSKKEELIKQLNSNNIKFVIKNENSSWRDYGNLENRNRKKRELRKQFTNCKVSCTSILDGNIYHCPRSSHGYNLKKIPLKEQDYINLLDENKSEKQLRKELYEFFYKYVPYVEACNYCNSATKEMKMIPSGEQYKKL